MSAPSDLEYLKSRLAHEKRVVENSDDISIRIVHSQPARQYAAKINLAERRSIPNPIHPTVALSMIETRDALADGCPNR